MKNKLKFLVPLVLLLWCIVACKTKTEKQVPSEEHTVLIQLTENATPDALEKDFHTVDLQQKKSIGNNMRIYLFTFNSQKIKLKQLLEQLRASELVLEAQANQSVSNRN